MQTSTTNAAEMGTHNGIEFTDFDVYKVWKLFKYNVEEILSLRWRHL